MSVGYKPDVISSDIHQVSIHGPMFDMPTCLSKFMALGMSFAEVIQASTERPAQVMGLQDEIGTLKPGALADIALFRIESGDFTFYDVRMNPRKGKQLVRNTLTLVNGREIPLVAEKPPAPWFELSESQQTLIERNHTPEAFDPKSGE
jgi:dihydroorotase